MIPETHFFSRLLGNFLEAAKDLRLACKIDYDDQAKEWLDEVTPNVSTILLFYFLKLYVAQWAKKFKNPGKKTYQVRRKNLA